MKESRDCRWPFGLPKPMQPPVRSERRDAMEHRQRILNEARNLFTAQGVDNVSMHQIALAAGIGQGTLYRRYANKGELCMDLLHESHERFVEEIVRLFTETEGKPALERLNGVLKKNIIFLEEQGEMLGQIALTTMQGLLCSEAESARRFSQHNNPFYSWLYQLLTGLLETAIKNRELDELDIPYTVDAILATLHPMLYRFQRQERGFTPERILQGLRHIYIDGLKRNS